MARPKKKDLEPMVAQSPKQVLTQRVRPLPLKRALKIWKNANPQKAMFFEDEEAVQMFAKRLIPTLESTQEEWNKVFEKF